MKSVSRRYLIDFATAAVPDEWTSQEVHDIYDQAMRDRFTDAFEKTAGTGSIKVIADNHMQPFEVTTGTSVIEAEAQIRKRIAKLRARADKFERRLETEGVTPTGCSTCAALRRACSLHRWS